MEFSKLMFQQRQKFCRIIKIPKEAHHRQLSDFLLSSFYAPKFLKTRQILRPTFKTTHSRVVNESRTASTKKQKLHQHEFQQSPKSPLPVFTYRK